MKNLQKRPLGYWHDKENIEREIESLANELGEFPTSSKIRSALGHWCDKSIMKFYPGGRKGLARKLGYTGFKYKKELKQGFVESGIIDPSNSRHHWEMIKLKTKGLTIVEGLSKNHSDILCQYMKDKEIGLYSSKRRKPSLARLCKVFIQMKAVLREIEREYHKDITSLTKAEMHTFFYNHGENYQKEVLVFYRHYVKKKREEGKEVLDITSDLKQERKENRFVYFTLEELKEVLQYFTDDEKALLLFAFDSICRAPKELSNILKRDITIDIEGNVWVTVRGESSKTFERKFNLVICAKEIKEYLARKNLTDTEPLFPFYALSQSYQENLSRRLKDSFIAHFGDKTTLGGLPYSKITLYSFRHSGSCYFQDKNIELKKLLFRGGWKSIDRLLYYSKMLGQSGRIDIKENEDLVKIIQGQNKKIEELTRLIRALSGGDRNEVPLLYEQV